VAWRENVSARESRNAFSAQLSRLSDFSLYCATATPRNSINAFRFPFAKCDTVV